MARAMMNDLAARLSSRADLAAICDAMARAGLPHLPLSIGVQGSYGTLLKTQGKMQGHVTAFFAFDMPLLMIEPLF